MRSAVSGHPRRPHHERPVIRSRRVSGGPCECGRARSTPFRRRRRRHGVAPARRRAGCRARGGAAGQTCKRAAVGRPGGPAMPPEFRYGGARAHTHAAVIRRSAGAPCAVRVIQGAGCERTCRRADGGGGSVWELAWRTRLAARVRFFAGERPCESLWRTAFLMPDQRRRVETAARVLSARATARRTTVLSGAVFCCVRAVASSH